MNFIRVEAGGWIIFVPFTRDGIKCAMAFLELLDKILTEKEAEG